VRACEIAGVFFRALFSVIAYIFDLVEGERYFEMVNYVESTVIRFIYNIIRSFAFVMLMYFVALVESKFICG